MNATQVLAALQAGHAKQQADGAVKEASRRGTLSGGGSAGAVIRGKWYGKCGRLALLRSRGFGEPKTSDTLDMFSAGNANEVIVAGLFESAGYSVERDAKLEYFLADGRAVTSHLDFLFRDMAGRPSLVVETKLVSSIWTAKDVNYELRPKSDHLIQLGHYLAQLPGAAGVLLYSSRCDWHVSTAPRFLQDKFRAGPHGPVHDIQYKDDGSPMKIRPFNRAYDVGFDDQNRLWYQTDGLDRVTTRLTKASMRAFYDGVSKAARAETLTPRPGAVGVDGFKTYSPCDYCQLKSVCDTHETSDFQTWLDHVQATWGE